MPGPRTEITELTTALGMVAPTLAEAVARRPPQLVNVPAATWERLVAAYDAGTDPASFEAAFANGRAFLAAVDGLGGRPPRRVEWKGIHRPPGDDVVPADLRIDRVFLVSCKYLSDVLVNAGPPRLFERLLAGDERSTVNWFARAAPAELEALYAAARAETGLPGLPSRVGELTRDHQRALKGALRARQWPVPLQARWAELCDAVAIESARRWRHAMASPRDRLRLLWRMLRITAATYFVLGAGRGEQLRLRVDSTWDWLQSYELRSFEVAPRRAGQPEVDWRANVRRRDDRREVAVDGHVEIRWSHGRFVGSPEAKVYLDTPHRDVPGYHPLC